MLDTHADRSLGVAWLALTFALALHVLDEALNHFLAVWNPWVATLREAVPFLPLPQFTFSVWLSGLIVAIGLLALLSPFAFRGVCWIRGVSAGLGILMMGNALLHITASIAGRWLMPGVVSSPLLLLAAANLLWRSRAHALLRPCTDAPA
jgi:hypothetical protein